MIASLPIKTGFPTRSGGFPYRFNSGGGVSKRTSHERVPDTVDLLLSFATEEEPEYHDLRYSYSPVQNPSIPQMIERINALSFAKDRNWDGEDADAVSESTMEVASRLAGLIPFTEGLDSPDIAPNARGEIDFSWKHGEKILIMGVCAPPEHLIAFAGLFGRSTAIRVRIPWKQQDYVSSLVDLCLNLLKDSHQ